MYIKILLFAMLFFTASLFSAEKNYPLTKEQLDTLKLVHDVAITIPSKKGETYEKTAMGIVLTETSAGVHKVGDIGKNPNIFKASLGIMQVRLETARFIAKKLKLERVNNMSDVELVNKLLSDDRFNAEIGIRYLVWLRDHTGSYFRAISRYNGGNKNTRYYNKVVKNMKKLENWLYMAKVGNEEIFNFYKAMELASTAKSPHFEKKSPQNEKS